MDWQLTEKPKKTKELPEFTESVTRYYSPEGEKWPILSISVYEGDNAPMSNGYIYHENFGKDRGFKVSCSKKDGPEKWWDECSFPTDLMYEVIEIILEFRKRLLKENGNISSSN